MLAQCMLAHSLLEKSTLLSVPSSKQSYSVRDLGKKH